MTPRARRVGFAAVVAAALTCGAGSAFAYFSVVGGGTGAGTTGTLAPVVVLPATTGTPTSTLLPGGTADLVVTVRNPNSTTVTVVGVAQGGGVVVQGGGAGCTSDPAWPATLGASGVTLTTTSGLSVSLSGGATQTFHVPAGAAMSTASASACQGATFQIPVTVSVRS